MSLKDNITEGMKDAMRAKDKPRLGAIRLILADIKRVEVDERIEVDDERVLTILDKMIKQRKDSIAQFRSAGREDLSAQEELELDVIRSFMPEPLSEEDIEKILAQAIEEQQASTMRDMGKVMNQIRPQLQGRADMAQVSQKLKQRLA